MWRVALVLVPMALTAAALACGGGADGGPGAEGAETVRGLLLEVNARSLLELETLTVRADDGAEWRLEARGKRFALFTPSHLREHMVSGLPVTVTFHRENGALVLDEIAD